MATIKIIIPPIVELTVIINFKWLDVTDYKGTLEYNF